MTTLTPEQRIYKERTLHQLRLNYARLQEKIDEEHRPDAVDKMQDDLEEIKVHISRLQQALVTNEAAEPVADELYRRIATALTNNKFFLAKKLINKLETIEPFYPNIDRLRKEAEAGRASRRTKSIAKGGSLPELVLPPEVGEAAIAQSSSVYEEIEIEPLEPERKGLARFFQFHVVASCLVVTLIACVMFGVGGMTALQWLIEGN